MTWHLKQNNYDNQVVNKKITNKQKNYIMKNKQYYALTESWLQNPANQTTIDELQKKFNDEVIEKFILFFFEPLLRAAQENGMRKTEFERPFKNTIELTKIAGIYEPFREIFQEINASSMLNALAKATYNEYKGKESSFTYERFLAYIEVI